MIPDFFAALYVLQNCIFLFKNNESMVELNILNLTIPISEYIFIEYA